MKVKLKRYKKDEIEKKKEKKKIRLNPNFFKNKNQ